MIRVDDGAKVLIDVMNIALYIYGGTTLQGVAKRANISNSWKAWVPILNVWLMIEVAHVASWWMILFFIPIVNIAALIMVAMRMAVVIGKPAWLGALMMIPLIVGSYVAIWG